MMKHTTRRMHGLPSAAANAACRLQSAVCAIAIIAVVLATEPCLGQTSDESNQPSAEEQVPLPTGGNADMAQVEAQSDAPPMARFRASLLREGTYLVEVPATIQHDSVRGWWKLLTSAQNPQVAPNDLVLLPCTHLTQMQQMVEASPSREIQFQVTGKVFVFRNVNYVLPTHVVVINSARASAASASPPTPASPDPTSQQTSQPTSPTQQTKEQGGDSAQDIIRELEQAAPNVPRSSGSARPTDSANVAPVHRHVPVASAVTADRVLVEETAVVNRRGRITRDVTGGWLFVFDADVSGSSDPPMRLMPCLLLERIEDHAQRQGMNAPALLNGTVYVYQGQNYLLPTVFRIPSERRNVTP